MGSVSSAISKAAREVGAHIVTNAEVVYFNQSTILIWQISAHEETKCIFFLEIWYLELFSLDLRLFILLFRFHS